jgi:HPr kinase/phosphorylase
MIELHATSVEISGKALIILGEAGTGKSSLAINLIGLGARLIADDQTRLHKKNGKVFASAPVNLPLILEARGFGFLTPPLSKEAPLFIIVNLSEKSENKIPLNLKEKILLGESFQEYFIGGMVNPAPAIFLLMRYGLVDPNTSLENLKRLNRSMYAK